MNLTEMESKVREATNNEPWGAPTTLMSQIASGTYNYREREEIIGFIFRRFTEKAANEWRQIYKSLQLLEYLVKNGSERVIDDVRANLSLIQMLKSFHYIDSKGRDQGINVRNRSKNLIALLNDDSLVRTERKKATRNAYKFGGVAGGASSIVPGNQNQDGDFTNRVYGDGGVYGERYDDPASAYSNGQTGSETFEEYDVGSGSGTSKPTTGSSKVNASAGKSKPQPKQPEQDLLGDDFFGSSSTSAPAATAPAATVPEDDDDDDFDDFQAAPSQPEKPAFSNNLANLYQAQPQQSFPQNFQQQNFQQQNFQQQNAQPTTSSYQNNQSFSISNASSGPAKTASNDAFSSLFSSAKTKNKSTPPIQKPAPTTTNAADDDFFGGFSTNSATNGASNGNGNGNSSNGNSNKNTSGEIDLLSF